MRLCFDNVIRILLILRTAGHLEGLGATIDTFFSFLAFVLAVLSYLINVQRFENRECRGLLREGLMRRPTDRRTRHLLRQSLSIIFMEAVDGCVRRLSAQGRYLSLRCRRSTVKTDKLGATKGAEMMRTTTQICIRIGF